MLGHRVDERVPRASVLQEEAAHTRRDRPKVPPLQQHGEGKRQDAAGGCEHAVAQLGVLGAATGDAALFSQDVNQSEDLVDEEDDERRDLLHALERRPCDDGDLHGANRADDEEERVRLVHAWREAPAEQQHCGVEPNHVDDKGVAAPCGNHVHIGEASQGADGPRTGIAQRAGPHVEHHHHRGDLRTTRRIHG